MTKIIVALYDDVALAQKAVDALLAEDLPPSDVSMLSNETIAAIAGAAEGSGEPGPLGDAEVSGGDLVPRLVKLGVDRSAAEAYAEGVRRGGALVVVRTADAHAPKAVEIMDQAGALAYEAYVASWRSEGWTYDPSAEPFTAAEADAERRRRSEVALPTGGRHHGRTHCPRSAACRDLHGARLTRYPVTPASLLPPQNRLTAPASLWGPEA